VKSSVDHKFIFVCGLHRSGTSILFRSLREHPLISGFENTNSPEDEGMHLQSVYKPSGHYGGAGKFGFSPEAHLTETSSLVTEANRKKLFEEWCPYWDISRPFLLEKSPPNVIRTRFLQAMFPDSYFIILTRHPVAVTLATQAWYRKFQIHRRRLDKLIEHWTVCHEISKADSQHLKNHMRLSYENFVQHPQESLDRIYTWLNLEKLPNNQIIKTNINDKYFEKWRSLANQGLSKYLIRSIVQHYEARINMFGYSLKELDRTDPVIG
jgi:Sulfotransferase family